MKGNDEAQFLFLPGRCVPLEKCHPLEKNWFSALLAGESKDE